MPMFIRCCISHPVGGGRGAEVGAHINVYCVKIETSTKKSVLQHHMSGATG